jgi:glycosyltransferase involved in cell wall biosynthesis
MMAISDILLERETELHITFTGEVVQGAEVCEVFQYWLSRHPMKERIHHQALAFDEMPGAYQHANLVVIPTIFSEGTSLSCLEAMSCGVPVVATNVGGLNDLIVDGFNGRLVQPTVESLVTALSELLHSEEQRERLGRQARETAKAYDLSLWRQRWIQTLTEYVGETG